MNKVYKVKSIEYDTNCTAVNQEEFNSLIKGSYKANGMKIKKLIKRHDPEFYKELGLRFFNPYQKHCRRTKTHFIFVHSAIEYFFKIIN